MPVNLDADIRNADWIKSRTNDLPQMNRRSDLDAIIRDVPHWLAELPSANPEAVHSVWHLLTEEERAIYNQRAHRENRLGLPILRDNGLVVLSLRAGADSLPIAHAVVAAFESASSRFADNADVDAIERSLVGLSDHLLESLQGDFIPAVVERVEKAENEARHALQTARRRSATADPFRSAARTPASVASARRYALNRALLLVDDLSATARKAARDILSRDDLKEASRIRRLKAVLGLSERQHETYMRNLVAIDNATSATEFDLGSFGVVDVPAGGLSPVQFQALADRYASHLLNQRATLIAKTEGTTIREETRRALWEREEPDATFTWVTVGETCDDCRALDGVEVRAGEEYAPDVLTPPAHPGCDCTQGVRI